MCKERNSTPVPLVTLKIFQTMKLREGCMASVNENDIEMHNVKRRLMA
jgi:hypothetical protein